MMETKEQPVTAEEPTAPVDEDQPVKPTEEGPALNDAGQPVKPTEEGPALTDAEELDYWKKKTKDLEQKIEQVEKELDYWKKKTKDLEQKIEQIEKIVIKPEPDVQTSSVRFQTLMHYLRTKISSWTTSLVQSDAQASASDDTDITLAIDSMINSKQTNDPYKEYRLNVLDPCPSEATGNFLLALEHELEKWRIKITKLDPGDFQDNTFSSYFVVVCNHTGRLVEDVKSVLFQFSESQCKHILLALVTIVESKDATVEVLQEEISSESSDFQLKLDQLLGVIFLYCNVKKSKYGLYQCATNSKAIMKIREQAEKTET